ncbi:MAG: family 20 glycosylhydrolase [Flavobacteriales bacterium]|nr:family 20 glycosylhydrolase [Flavobacteriales bacterium]
MRFIPALFFLSAFTAVAQEPVQPALIPLPAEMELTGGSCSLECPWSLQADRTVSSDFMELLRAEVKMLHPVPEIECVVPLAMELHLLQPGTLLPTEWYSLQVTSDHIALTATTEEGLFRGSRTLIQLLEQGQRTGSIPCLSITDHPRFGWRGMHLDVVRHFFPVSFVKRYIDLLARYKMNSFHWHLTDDQGWRIEIKKYPLLTEIGGWRKGSQVGPYDHQTFDSVRYGGFYTQAQIREVVAYAATRHINVVPEIEMPGHAMAALSAYPQLGCTGGPYEAQRGWGVFDDVFCAGNDTVFTVLEDVLTEVMGLFPSPYIHIGGDECPKEQWKACRKCQTRMQAEGLQDEHELQSWFIQRIEQFVNSKGRKIIGWDEILEGGLAPNAAVMSWRGTEGGVAAAQSGHFAVMSPGSHCYFDHYQGDPANEPLAIGGFTPLQKVYSYEPVPEELNAAEAKYILGAQANLWTEYILTTEHVEYMILPRMLALAEVLWSPKEKRDEADFLLRLEQELPRLDAMHLNYAKSLYQVSILPEQGAALGTIDVHFKGSREGMPIRYELITDHVDPDASDPRNDLQARHMDRAGDPLTIRSACSIEAWVEDSTAAAGPQGMPRSKQQFTFNKATARPTTLSLPPHDEYNTGGAFTLVNGITAQDKRVNNEWLAWRKSVSVTVDLGSEQAISHLSIGALSEPGSWIHLPKEVVYSVSSDGKKFVPFGIAKDMGGKGRHAFTLEKTGKARYVRIDVENIGNIPDGFAGAGRPAFVFLDEIEVR